MIFGNVRVSVVYSIGLHELPPYIKWFLKSFPNVNVHIEYRRANQVYEMYSATSSTSESWRSQRAIPNWRLSHCAKTPWS